MSLSGAPPIVTCSLPNPGVIGRYASWSVVSPTGHVLILQALWHCGDGHPSSRPVSVSPPRVRTRFVTGVLDPGVSGSRNAQGLIAACAAGRWGAALVCAGGAAPGWADPG